MSGARSIENVPAHWRRQRRDGGAAAVVFALNSISRAMGTRKRYPFMLSPTVIHKLSFIHDLVQGRVP
jgi:hypothetical protein